MDAMSIPAIKRLRYELRVGCLFNAGRAFVSPCDAAVRADASLTEAVRRSYRPVCASVRREVSLRRCP
jgi:hypothetical protein